MTRLTLRSRRSVVFRVCSHRLRLLPAALAIGLLGCGDFTNVDTADVVSTGSLENKLGAEALRAGVLSAFSLAYGGNQILNSGAMADEIFATHNNVNADRRVESSEGGVDDLHQVRVNGLFAIETMRKVSGPATKIGELFAIIGYTEVFFAENVCSGMPLSSIQDGRPIFGQPLTTVQMLERAIADFDSAVAQAPDSVRIVNLARLGKGRALLNLGRFTEAAAAVAQVPNTYRYVTEYTVPAQPNGVYRALNISRHITIADKEGINGLDFRTANDPRVRTRFVTNQAYDGTPVYAPANSHETESSPAVLASGTEARLIEAEALLKAGDAVTALAKLNALRAMVAGLQPLALESSADARVNQLFRERAFWLFLTGHRLGDMRRLIRQYGRTSTSVFPTGAYKAGLQYENAVNMQPSGSERNNPNFKACLNRDA